MEDADRNHEERWIDKQKEELENNYFMPVCELCMNRQK